MPGSTISITFKLDGQEKTFQVLGKDLRGLKDTLDATVLSAEKMERQIIRWSNVASACQALGNVVSQLSSAFSGLTEATAVQQAAEAQLAESMRNTMGATDEQIQSIKDLASAQQQLGVIGDEIQLQGAQRLASFLSEKESLEALIPVMNDMAAARYGLNVSGENMASIAEQIGKAMNGQVSALKRLGIQLSETEQATLEYGDESAKAVTIARILDDRFGGMNETLSKTASGGLKQFSNKLGDLHEKLGAMVQPLTKILTVVSQLIVSMNGFAQLQASVNAISKAFNFAAFKAATWGRAVHALEVRQRAYNIATIQGRIATNGLKAAIMGLSASTGVGIILAAATAAITALVGAISKLVSKSREAKEAAKEVSEAELQFKETFESSSGEISLYIKKLDKLVKCKKEEPALIEELNSKYGESFGYYKTAGEWYDTLIAKSKDYCKALGYEAQAKILGNKYAELSLEKEALEAEALRMYGNAEDRNIFGGLTKDAKDVDAKWRNVSAEMAKIEGQITDCLNKADGLRSTLPSGETTPPPIAPLGDTDKGLDRFAEAVRSYRDSIASAIDVNKAMAQGQNEQDLTLKTMESGLVSLIKTYGSEKKEIRELIDEYFKLARARSESLSIEDLSPIEGKLLGKAGTAGGNLIPQKDIDTIKEIPDIAGAAQQSLGALSSTFSSLGKIVGESAAAWLDWASNLISAISQAIPQIVALTAAQKGKANADAEGAVAGGMSAVANIPYVGPALAVAAAASIVAALAAIPKFAKGGIAFGPTLGMFGEYAGASSNPEIVAPLDKLRTMIQPASYDFDDVKFRIEGRDLVGVLGKRSILSSRT